ncbi:MAG: thiamine phosphate synthase, partial [Erysipelotrichaceae bacterium]|nr:thiamine phosphate synthase [Erysipelotrichaceae bacterium]
MKSVKDWMLLYAVTDRSWTQNMSLEDQVKAALENGITCLQVREKDLDDEAFLQEALRLKELCHQYDVPLVINDNVKVAIACQADGIHVGQEDMP